MVMTAYVLYYTTSYESGSCAYIFKIYFHHFYMLAEFFDVIFMIMTFVFSILAIKRLSRTQAIHAHLNQEQQKVRARQTQAAVRMVLASLLLYALCLFPLSVFTFLNQIHRIRIVFRKGPIFPPCMDWSAVVFIIYRCFPLLNSCFSPCIYIVFLSDFRGAAKKVLCRKTNRIENRRNSIELKQMEHHPPIETE